MLSFIHTSDWHLGHIYRKLGARAAESGDWRFEAAQRVFDLALEKSVDFIVVAGDVFDTGTPSEPVIQRAVELLRDAPVPTYFISGNHDPLAEGSVWLNQKFQGALQAVPHVRIAYESEPIAVRGGDALLFPCPVKAQHSREDAAAWIPDSERSRDQARIGLAHGHWNGYWQSGEVSEFNSIDDRTADRCGLDYLALGDYHSFTPADHHATRARTYYSGTPEVSAHDDARAGHALLVEIEAPGTDPLVTPLPTGHAHCHNWGKIILHPGDGLSALQTRLDAIADRETALVRAQLAGVVSHNEWNDLHEWLGLLRESVLGADINTSQLLTEPTRSDFSSLNLEAPEQRLLELLDSPLTAADLNGIADGELIARWSTDENARRAARTLLYQLLQNE